MIIALGSDHAGFEQKQLIVSYLKDEGYEVIDFGPATDDRCDYPDYADLVARSVAKGEADRGVLVCGTGLGVAITADKVPGIRAVPVQTVEFARLAREHNDCNVICLSGRFVEPETNFEIVDTFLTTQHAGGRHTGRVEKIMREDDPMFTGVNPEDL